MKIVLSELDQNYDTYSFGYTPHAILEEPADVPIAYESGYLPYSAAPTPDAVFYMARSLRVKANSYMPTSENRRIAKKYDGSFTCDYVHDLAGPDADHAKDLFVTYFTERHGNGIMPRARIDDLFSKALPIRLARYSRDGVPVAHVLECIENTLLHFWFSCFDNAYYQSSLGMWLMQDSIRRARDENRTFVYLGTGYGKKARYKMNIPQIQFWDGTTWLQDEARLRSLLAEDEKRETTATSRFYR